MRSARLFGLVASALLGCSKKDAPNQLGRPELDVGGVRWEIIDGSWKKDGDVLIGSGGHIQTKKDFGDATLELDIEEASANPPGAAGDTIGIGFRYLLTYDDLARANGYMLELLDSTFTVVRGANNYWQPVNPELRGFQRSGLFVPRKNHLAIAMTGATFRIDVNHDTLLAFEDRSYAHGHASLWVESAMHTVRFSNVRVTP